MNFELSDAQRMLQDMVRSSEKKIKPRQRRSIGPTSSLGLKRMAGSLGMTLPPGMVVPGRTSSPGPSQEGGVTPVVVADIQLLNN
jgi:hypothetical protein